MIGILRVLYLLLMAYLIYTMVKRGGCCGHGHNNKSSCCEDHGKRNSEKVISDKEKVNSINI